MTVRRTDGTLVKDVHAENVVVVPDSVRDLERRELNFENEDDPLIIHDIDRKRSPGQMIEDDGEEVRRQEKAVPTTGRMDKVQVGGYVAYQTFKGTSGDRYRRTCSVERC